MENTKQKNKYKMLIANFAICNVFYYVLFLLFTSFASAGELKLQDLINEALKNNPEILASEARVSASKHRVPQAESLPDPMFMAGYQNEGFDRYTYGETADAQWMFSTSQMIPFPGKLSLKGEMAEKDSESLKASSESVRLQTILKVKELFYNLFLAYKSIDLVKGKSELFLRIEDAALSRYSTGMAPQQDITMAQTEKYMLIEKEEMLKQKIQSMEGMLNSTIGRDVNFPVGRPAEPAPTAYIFEMDKLLKIANENSPEIKSREKMLASADAKVRMAKKEYFPDFTITGSIMKKREPFEDMWSLTTSINIPIFFRSKQKAAVKEADALMSETGNELTATKLMVSSAVRDNYSMVKTAERLIELYKNGLIPKTYQDFESAMSGYSTGKIEAAAVINRLKSVLDFEILYWEQFIQRENAIARLEAITGIQNSATEVKEK